jgi:hypothetical protein
MGTEAGSYSYIEMNRRRDVEVSLSPRAVVRLVANGDLDPDIAAEALQVAEQRRIKESERSAREQAR